MKSKKTEGTERSGQVRPEGRGQAGGVRVQETATKSRTSATRSDWPEELE